VLSEPIQPRISHACQAKANIVKASSGDMPETDTVLTLKVKSLSVIAPAELSQLKPFPLHVLLYHK